MENDIKQYIKQQNEDLFNNKFDIKNINELNQNENIYNLNIKEKNPEAFITVNESAEVLGEGFKSYN